jgi:hypothetical protein
MKTKGALVISVFGLVVWAVACARLSQRNESCQRTSDCDGDLVCVGGTCGPVNLGITPGPNVCVAVQCSTADDCCATPPCTNFACTAGKCVSTTTCTMNSDCFGTGFNHCFNSACVECVVSTDCGFKQTCNNNVCGVSCTNNNECPIFFACTASACTEVGCASDRECVLYKNSEFAFCDNSTKPPSCSVKCDNDSECGKLELCVSHSCVNAGCSTDEECKAILGTLPPGEHAVCQPKM